MLFMPNESYVIFKLFFKLNKTLYSKVMLFFRVILELIFELILSHFWTILKLLSLKISVTLNGIVGLKRL